MRSTHAHCEARDALCATSFLPHAQIAAAPHGIDLCDASFGSSFVDELPGDTSTHNAPRLVRDACYTRVEPTPVAAPRLLAWSDAAGALLGLARPVSCAGPAVEVLSGNRLLPGMAPYAARYGGHQFGVWAGQLGDGRAITLGELTASDGTRQELQLKGSGRTPYSRTADGRAVLRSSLREFLCSEAMHHLGVATTRALALVGSGETVVRDMFYDGNPEPEPGAIVCRVAPSFVRFGNFEILAAFGEIGTLRQLADYVIRRCFPELGAPSRATYALWFEDVCRRTARLMAEWTRVGFVHGVMNTDNMSILGLTIDYGPYGWLEPFDPDWTPNTTDAERRRYRYGVQPQIAQWNLARLAGALLPLIEKAALERGLALYCETFERESSVMTAAKFGLTKLEGEEDERLVSDLFALFGQVETDMTLFFRGLATVPVDGFAEAADDSTLAALLRRAFYGDDALRAPHVSRVAAWLRRYVTRVRRDAAGTDARIARMNRANPKYVLRNYLAQQAVDALAYGDTSPMERLMSVLSRPYDEQPAHNDLAEKRPEWARHRPGCSMLSCSS